MNKSTGFILYEGPSMLDSSPIVVVATMETDNRKTGPMIQTWILRADVEPHHAVRTGQDASVCGQCPHRHHLDGACYVLPFQAPLAVFRAWKRGAYVRFDYANPEHAAAFADRLIRIGAYGDGAAAPYIMWASVVGLCAGHTGYTHQARHPKFDSRMLTLCMVSADTMPAAKRAQAQGHRTFRVVRAGDPIMPNEVECKADSHGATCAECLLCGGNAANGPNIYIEVHGQRAGRF